MLIKIIRNVLELRNKGEYSYVLFEHVDETFWDAKVNNYFADVHYI